MTERAGDAIQATSATMRRRGLIAGAAALVAGMVANQTAQPVAAAAVTADNFIANGTATYGYDTFNGTFAYGVYAKGTNYGVLATSSAYGVYGTSSSGEGVYGNTNAPTG